jgi:hypothetical protein
MRVFGVPGVFGVPLLDGVFGVPLLDGVFGVGVFGVGLALTLEL